HVLRHAELRGLHRVVVRHDGAEEDVAGARQIRQPRGDETAGARLGSREREPPLAAEVEHELCGRALVAREDVALVRGRKAALELVGPLLRTRLHEEVDMNLEIARTDRHVHAVAVAARIGERLGDGRLGDAEQPQHASCRRPGAREQPCERRRLKHPRPELLQLPRGPRQRDRDPAAVLEHHRGRRADEPDPARADGQRRLLAHTGREVGVRAAQALGDPPRQLLDPGRQLLVEREPTAGRPGEQLDRAVVVRRPEAAGDDEQVLGETGAQRRLEVGRVVADDGDPCGLDAEAEERRGEKRPVAIRTVAADELGARGDERGPDAGYAGRQPVGVTTITRGWRPGTWTSFPRTRIVTFSGELICSQRRRPRIATGWPRSTVPSNLTAPVAESLRAMSCDAPCVAATSRSGGTTCDRDAVVLGTVAGAFDPPPSAAFQAEMTTTVRTAIAASATSTTPASMRRLRRCGRAADLRTRG